MFRLELVIPSISTVDAAWLAALALLALLVQAVAQPVWLPSWAKKLITVVIALVAGLVYFVVTGQLSDIVNESLQATIIHWFIIVIGFLVAVKALYEFFKPSLTKLETSTTFLSVPAPTADPAISEAVDAVEADDPEVASDEAEPSESAEEGSAGDTPAGTVTA